MTRCPDEYRKQWKTKQMKSRWQKQKKKEFRNPIVEEEIKIARMIEEKQKEEKDLIEIRIVEEIVFRRFYKYLEVFKKKESKRILIRKTWDYAINLREEFVPKKRKIYLLSRVEKKEVQKFIKD